MPKSTNRVEISTALPLKFERVKKHLKEDHDLLWTDFLVLCALVELEKTQYFIQTSDIIQYIGRNPGMVYTAVKRLNEKQFIGLETPEKKHQPREIYINGWGHSFLKTMFRRI